MSVAFVDSSYMAAIALGEGDSDALATSLKRFEQVAASPLLDAELRAAFIRERRTLDETLLEPIIWVHTDRPLSPEIRRVLKKGYLRGADCFHLACALSFAADTTALTFLTLDTRQRAVAKALGFKT